MIKLVIFDLDGTLLNSLEDLAASTNYALRQHGYPTHELPAFRYFVGNGINKLLERALPEKERTHENMLKIREDFMELWYRRMLHGTIVCIIRKMITCM